MKPRLSTFVLAASVVYFAMPSRRGPENIMEQTANLSTEENIKFHGYPVEKHTVEAEDGFLLQLTRMPRNDSGKLPLLIVHGFMSSSRAWVAMGPDASLGYKLFDAGYDVWLADLRGNEYSLDHKSLSKSDPEFWKFSYHEMGIYDQPAMIDYILNKTGAPKLIHVGYSMGSGSFFIMNSMRPEMDDKVEAHIAMAPGVFFKHSTSVYWKLHYFFVIANKVIGRHGTAGAYGHGLMQKFLQTFCTHNFITRYIGRKITSGITGPSDTFQNETLYKGVIKNGLIGSSVRTAQHFLQLHKTGNFQQYDYGSASKNMKHYGQSTPPQYDLSRSSVPVYLFNGATDAVCCPKDVARLKGELTNLKNSTQIDDPVFNHADFFIGSKVAEQLSPLIVDTVELISLRYQEASGVIKTDRLATPTRSKPGLYPGPVEQGSVNAALNTSENVDDCNIPKSVDTNMNGI